MGALRTCAFAAVAFLVLMGFQAAAGDTATHAGEGQEEVFDGGDPITADALGDTLRSHPGDGGALGRDEGDTEFPVLFLASESGLTANDEMAYLTAAGFDPDHTCDDRDRMLTETFTIDATAYTVTYTHDVASNVLSLDPPGTSDTLYYAYDAYNRACSASSLSTATCTTGSFIAPASFFEDDLLNTITYGSDTSFRDGLGADGS